MTNWKSVRIGCAAGALTFMLAGSAIAFFDNHENQLTFNRPVSLPGIVLPAGSYTFDMVSGTLDVVVVRNTTKVLYTGFTRTVERPASLSKTAAITLGEAPAEPPRITAWYEIGDALGHEFRY
jgi:hypothetical protein